MFKTIKLILTSYLILLTQLTSAAILQANPSEYDFGDVIIEQNSLQTFTITNTSSLQINISLVELIENWVFNLTTNNCEQTLLAPTESCTITISYSPIYFNPDSEEDNINTDTLRIFYNSENEDDGENEEGEIQISLIGTATIAPIAAPELIAPSGIINTKQPTFTWHQTNDDILKYHLSITDATNNTTELELYSEDVCNYETATCKVSPHLTLAPGNAHWKALSVKQNGEFLQESPWSDPLNFRIELPGTIQFSQSTHTINENQTSITLTVNRTNGSAGNISVNYITIPNTATAGNDYVTTSGTLQWNDGETGAKTFTINILNDSAVEPNETFTVNLNNPTGAAILGSTTNSQITIINDDIAALIINEIDFIQTTNSTDFIELKNISSNTINLKDYTIQLINLETHTTYKTIKLPETLIKAGDYYIITTSTTDFIQNINSNAIILLKNDWQQDIIKAPALKDSPDVPYLGLSRFPDGTNTLNNYVDFSQRCITPGAANIEANSHCYELSINDVTINEAKATAQFTLKLNQANVVPVSVDYTTTNHTATAGTDYIAIAPTTITFAPGETSKTISIQINNDNLDETPTEQFFLKLSNPKNATLIDNTGICTIIDDDEPPTLNFNELTAIEGNTGSKNANFKVNLNAPSSLIIQVNYATTDNTATAGEDYQAINTTTLTFNPGETEKTFPIKIYGDFLDEPNEQLFLNFTNPINTILANTQATVTIADDDLLDIDGPEINNIKFNGQALIEGQTITQSGTISLNATDHANISRVEFLIDNKLFHSDSNGSNQYTAFLSIQNLTNGNHNINIKAYDTLNNLSTTNINIFIALAPPAAPIITQPKNGKITNQKQIIVTGTAEKNSQVFLYRNGTQQGTALNLNQNNSFSGSLTLESGQNNLTAAASNRGGLSEFSNTVQITLDTSIPNAPTGLAAEARNNGQVRLTWQASSSGYDIYRASSSFTNIAQAQKVNAQLITTTSFDDLVPTDGWYYYRIIAKNSAGTESVLSNQVTIYADSTPPRATQIKYFPENGNFSTGKVNLTLTVNEPLLTTPFLSIVPNGGIPIAIELTPVGETQYQGHFEITKYTKSGTAYAVFSARDKAGNRGTAIDSGNSIEIDNQGPFVTKITITPPEPINNSEITTVQVTIEINEVPAVRPDLSYLLSKTGSQAQELNLTAIGERVYQANFTLPTDAGLDETENLQFLF